MRERNKEIIKDGFLCLINNNSAIRGAKNGPLWLTIVMFVLSIILPVLPILIAQSSINGSYFLSTYSFGLERYITSIGLDLKNNRLAEFSINEDHLLSVSENNVEVNFANYGSVQPYANYTNTVSNQYDFLVYLAVGNTKYEKQLINQNIESEFYEIGTVNRSTESTNIYRPSYMILFKDGIYVALFGNNSTTCVANSYVGDFDKIKPSNTFLTDLLTVKDKEGNLISENILNDDYTTGVLNNFKKVLDASYENAKIVNTWGSTGIYAGVFFGLSLLMGFLMWLLTRGKSNPNNYFSLWLCYKLQGRLALAPGLITFIVGLFMAGQAPLIFIMTMGLRVMWISMKQLRPMPN